MNKMNKERKWEQVGSIRNVRDRATGEIQSDKFYFQASRDIKAGERIALFQVDKSKLQSRLDGLVESKKMSEDFAQDLLETTVFEGSRNLQAKKSE